VRPHASAEPITFEYRYFLGNPEALVRDHAGYSYLEPGHVGGPETSTAELGVVTPLRCLTLSRSGPEPNGTNTLIDLFYFEAAITDLDSGETGYFTFGGRLTGP
jgi:hypothetical protein